MDENKKKRPRPRRSVDEIGHAEPKPIAEPKPVAEPKPAAQPKPVPQSKPAAEPKPAAQPKPVPQPKPAAEPKPAAQPKPVPQPKPAAEPKPAAQPIIEESENEKTRLTAVQPKADAKTSTGPLAEFEAEEEEEEEESSGTLGGVFKTIIYMTFVLVISILLAYGIIMVANDIFAFVKPDTAVEVVVPEDASVEDIANILGEAGIIRYPKLFTLYAGFQDVDGYDKEGNSVFLPGTYAISPMKNYQQLLYAFQKQYTRDTVWVTFPEGSTVEDIITILTEEHGISTRADLVRAINEYDYGMEFLKDIDMSGGRHYRLEGYLFPDTYQFYTDSSAETIIYKMLVNFEKKLFYIGDDYCKERLAELGMTLDEVVILASMIEKEVKYAIDYDQVSSVFHNRLGDKANFPKLESDATTVYAILMATGERPETLGANELAFDDPYNTRLVSGFPPGAIGNPGYEALYCAFYPAKTNYYYFVADSRGYNLYAKTLAGHNENKASIRKEAAN